MSDEHSAGLEAKGLGIGVCCYHLTPRIVCSGKNLDCRWKCREPSVGSREARGVRKLESRLYIDPSVPGVHGAAMVRVFQLTAARRRVEKILEPK